jgi:hypothetical protein
MYGNFIILGLSDIMKTRKLKFLVLVALVRYDLGRTITANTCGSLRKNYWVPINIPSGKISDKMKDLKTRKMIAHPLVLKNLQPAALIPVLWGFQGKGQGELNKGNTS